MACTFPTLSKPTTSFSNPSRVNGSVLASAEKQALLWLAKRLPEPIHSDHLTLLGFAALTLVGTLTMAGPAARTPGVRRVESPL